MDRFGERKGLATIARGGSDRSTRFASIRSVDVDRDLSRRRGVRAAARAPAGHRPARRRSPAPGRRSSRTRRTSSRPWRPRVFPDAPLALFLFLTAEGRSRAPILADVAPETSSARSQTPRDAFRDESACEGRVRCSHAALRRWQSRRRRRIRPLYYFPRERDEREFARSRHSQKK